MPLRRWRRGLLSLLASSGVLLASGCQQRPPRLELALNPWPGSAYFVLARDLGRIDPARVALVLSSHDDPVRQMEAYISGRAQAIATTLVDVVTLCGVAPERCPVIVLVIDESRGADQLLGRRGIRDLAALVGRPIGVERSALARYVLVRAFESRGLPAPAPALLRELPPRSWPAALREGRVDAVLSYPPRSAWLQRDQPLEPLFSTEELPGEILDVLAVDPDVLRRHPGAVMAVVQGWQRMRQAEDQRPLAIRAAMARQLGLDADGQRILAAQIRYPGFQEQYELLDPRQNNLPPVLERIRRVLDAHGVIPANTPLPATDDTIIRRLAEDGEAADPRFPG